MKILNIILITLLVFSFTFAHAATAKIFKMENGKIYYNTGHNVYRLINKADAESFKVIKDDYFKDKNNVYYMSNIVAGADPATFKLLNDYYGKDKNNIYFGSNMIPSADLNTFVKLSDTSPYGKDKNNIYYRDSILKKADVNSFKVLHKYAKDKNNVYWSDYIVTGANTNSFIELEDEYGKDLNNYFFGGKMITNLIMIHRAKELENNGFNYYAKKNYHTNLFNHLKGNIIIKVKEDGEAYYLNPANFSMHYLGGPNDAFSIMQQQGIGITNDDLFKIPIGLSNLNGHDTDSDGLPDLFEDAIGTDKNNPDSDNDGYSDKVEIANNYNPNGVGKLNIDNNFSNAQKGKIFLQVEKEGEAWYVSPVDGKRYFIGKPSDAFNIMRNLGLGISNSDFDNLSI